MPARKTAAKPSTTAAKTVSEAAQPADLVKADSDIQKAFDAAEAQGAFGVLVDPTPNEHYTVAGVLAGKPTPETDEAAARKAHAALNQTAEA